MLQQAAEEGHHPVHDESWTWICSFHQEKVKKVADKAGNIITNIITNFLHLCLLNPFKYKYNDWQEKGGETI